MSEASVIVTTSGTCECLYTEAVDLSSLGELSVRRATDIGFDNRWRCWRVRDPSGFEMFTSHSRQECLEWERGYLQERETAKHGGLK